MYQPIVWCIDASDYYDYINHNIYIYSLFHDNNRETDFIYYDWDYDDLKLLRLESYYDTHTHVTDYFTGIMIKIISPLPPDDTATAAQQKFLNSRPILQKSPS